MRRPVHFGIIEIELVVSSRAFRTLTLIALAASVKKLTHLTGECSPARARAEPTRTSLWSQNLGACASIETLIPRRVMRRPRLRKATSRLRFLEDFQTPSFLRPRDGAPARVDRSAYDGRSSDLAKSRALLRLPPFTALHLAGQTQLVAGGGDGHG